MVITTTRLSSILFIILTWNILITQGLGVKLADILAATSTAIHYFLRVYKVKHLVNFRRSVANDWQHDVAVTHFRFIHRKMLECSQCLFREKISHSDCLPALFIRTLELIFKTFSLQSYFYNNKLKY